MIKEAYSFLCLFGFSLIRNDYFLKSGKSILFEPVVCFSYLVEIVTTPSFIWITNLFCFPFVYN